MHPISNSLPDSVFVRSVPPRKSASFAHNMPGNMSTYVFATEAAYHAHYRAAFYGVTRKKTGWDSGRHLEILACGCMPFFADLDQLPTRTLALYPRAGIAAAMALPGVRTARDGADPRWYLDRDRFEIDGPSFDDAAYFALGARVLAVPPPRVERPAWALGRAPGLSIPTAA